jgi:Domain of unknown function (DUF1918)
MNANVGDHLVLRGHGSHGDDLRGEIVDIVGERGSPPYVVRWPNGYSTLFIASPDAYIDPACGRTRLPRVDQPPPAPNVGSLARSCRQRALTTGTEHGPVARRRQLSMERSRPADDSQV